ncbi:hypothetical protein ACWT_4436 [Actinoplanes sp. SE50]|nr:hypothetical protein ACPL_4567 [Actinoplanes sp. SE50/110]ATO83851.1 hypothetical protein ACWT_4436 [Actinoplanes sp. SE50]SLM01261.1 hypothetical protein ACSP50_4497 [Actinoplanes sp. SE50/110]
MLDDVDRGPVHAPHRDGRVALRRVGAVPGVLPQTVARRYSAAARRVALRVVALPRLEARRRVALRVIALPRLEARRRAAMMDCGVRRGPLGRPADRRPRGAGRDRRPRRRAGRFRGAVLHDRAAPGRPGRDGFGDRPAPHGPAAGRHPGHRCARHDLPATVNCRLRRTRRLLRRGRPAHSDRHRHPPDAPVGVVAAVRTGPPRSSPSGKVSGVVGRFAPYPAIGGGFTWVSWHCGRSRTPTWTRCSR